MELTLYVLRRDIYHCTPSQLENEPWENILADIAIRNAIARTSK